MGRAVARGGGGAILGAVSKTRSVAALVALVALACGTASVQLHSTPSSARATPPEHPDGRAAYVRDTGAILGDEAAESALLARASERGIHALFLYGLGPVLADEARSAALARFLARARAAGMAELGAPIAGLDRLQAIVRYEDAHPEARFDAVASELEYWNGCGEGVARAECFSRFLALLDAMHAEAAPRHWVMIAYLGHPTRAESVEIARRVERVHVDLSIDDPAHAFDHRHDGAPLSDRWRALGGLGIGIWPILYAHGDVDLAAWLARGRTIDEAEREVVRARVAAGSDLDPVGGFIWFTLDAVP